MPETVYEKIFWFAKISSSLYLICKLIQNKSDPVWSDFAKQSGLELEQLVVEMEMMVRTNQVVERKVDVLHEKLKSHENQINKYVVTMQRNGICIFH
jgi:hypothetical protein